MTLFEKWQIVIQVVGISGLLITLFIYYKQLRTMSEQLKVDRGASSAQNILALTNFLQAPEVRSARETVRTKLVNKEYTLWDDAERSEASMVCSTYDVAAIIIKLGLVPSQPFVENWGQSIRHCYEVTKALIDEMQKPENSGPTYWDDFE